MDKENLTAARADFEAIVATIESASLGNLFGKPCGKMGKKAFVAFFQEAMVFKIGREEAALLQQKYIGSVNWDPSGKGRPMKDWVQVPHAYQADWAALAEKAIDFLIEG